MPIDRGDRRLTASFTQPVEQTHGAIIPPRAEDGPIPDVGGIPINIDPTLFKWDGVPLQITWHGFFTALGTLAGIWIAVRLATRAGFTEDDTFSVAMWGVIGAIVGARLFHVIDQWDFYARDPIAILKVNEGGLAIYGTIVGGPIAGAVYAWRRGLNVTRLADISAAPLILGMAIGRIGDIINGEHHGVHATGFPLAVVYTNPNTLGEINVPVHLAVGYELVMDVVIFAGLLWLARGLVRTPNRRWRFNWEPRLPRDGMLFWTNIFIYSSGRFFIEFYRQDTQFALGLSQAQLLSVLSAMVGVWALIYQFNRARKHGPTLPAAQPVEVATAESEGEVPEHAPAPS
ncbi:MAG TPA: prolipoprotein diacylglyceryl transferase [Chloroflexota bacterium]|nr:prolipoprotein diacylglyceryl transferase [Chloroflexota bacterium]